MRAFTYYQHAHIAELDDSSSNDSEHLEEVEQEKSQETLQAERVPKALRTRHDEMETPTSKRRRQLGKSENASP